MQARSHYSWRGCVRAVLLSWSQSVCVTRGGGATFRTSDPYRHPCPPAAATIWWHAWSGRNCVKAGPTGGGGERPGGNNISPASSSRGARPTATRCDGEHPARDQPEPVPKLPYDALASSPRRGPTSVTLRDRAPIGAAASVKQFIAVAERARGRSPTPRGQRRAAPLPWSCEIMARVD